MNVMRMIWAGLYLGLSFGCADGSAPVQTPESKDQPGAAVGLPAEPVPYARGRWRLASPQVLARAVVWVSHILIRHDAASTQVPGTVFPWKLPAPATRTRADALRLASDIASLAEKDPDGFADLARQYSEDSTTRDRGGFWGGVRVLDLRDEPTLLDAVAAMKPGEVSRVIETPRGFEIVARHAPSPEANVTGLHIVLARRETAWLGLFAGKLPDRSTPEALSLAQSIYDEARREPGKFASLVQRHSEHPDKEVGGDMGTWSTHEPTAHSRAVTALAALAVGEVSPPVETHLGIEVLQRIADPPRRVYAMESIELAFDVSQPGSKEATLALAEGMIQEVRSQPARFDELRAQYCCTSPRRWVSGKDELNLSAAVDVLGFGEISARPIAQYLSVVIPRRVRPEDVPAQPAAISGVPAPVRVELDYLVSIMPRQLILRELLAAVEPRPDLAPTPEQLAPLRQLAEATNDDVMHAGGAMIRVLQAVFAGDASGELQRLFDERIARKVLFADRIVAGAD